MATLAGLVAAGCAREEAPPGNLPDTRPPQIASTRPDGGAVVPEFDGSVRIQFDEPVNVSPSYLRQIEASPAWRLETDFGFSDIRVRPEGGWREGVVYTLRFPSDLADILGNRREEGFGLRFSTGPPIPSTRASGRLLRRVDGGGVRDGRVIFLSETGDSIPYTAVSDTGGVFELEALPPGRYTAWGFEDLNANLSLDRRLEAHDSVAFELADTVSSARITLRIVEPDTTPPVLAIAEARDSLTVRLEFDDPLEPEQDTTAVRLAVTDTVTGRALPVETWAVGRLPETADATARDSVPADTVAADTAADPDSVDREPVAPRDTASDDTLTAPEPGGAESRSDTLPLPSTEVIVRLGRALEEGVYRVEIEGVTNLRGLTGGGDTTFVYEAVDDTAASETAERDTAAADTEAPPDTTSPPDTTPAARRAARGRGSG